MTIRERFVLGVAAGLLLVLLAAVLLAAFAVLPRW